MIPPHYTQIQSGISVNLEQFLSLVKCPTIQYTPYTDIMIAIWNTPGILRWEGQGGGDKKVNTGRCCINLHENQKIISFRHGHMQDMK